MRKAASAFNSAACRIFADWASVVCPPETVHGGIGIQSVARMHDAARGSIGIQSVARHARCRTRQHRHSIRCSSRTMPRMTASALNPLLVIRENAGHYRGPLCESATTLDGVRQFLPHTFPRMSLAVAMSRFLILDGVGRGFSPARCLINTSPTNEPRVLLHTRSCSRPCEPLRVSCCSGAGDAGVVRIGAARRSSAAARACLSFSCLFLFCFVFTQDAGVGSRA